MCCKRFMACCFARRLLTPQMAVVDPKKPHVWLRTFDAEVAPFRFFMPGSRSGGSSSSSSGGGSSGGVA